MKKASKSALTKRAAKKSFGKGVANVVGKVILFGLIGFVATFSLYMFNMENKLIYGVIYPFLQKHYNKQTRDRRI